MWRRRFISLVAILAIAGCGAPAGSTPGGAGTAGPSASAPGSSGPAPSLDPDPAFDAAALAHDVLAAGTDGQRHEAVLAVLRALHIGVYTPEGEPIVEGAERSGADFVVYDFQAEALALGVRDGDEIRLDDLITSLAAAGPDAEAGDLPVAEVGVALAAAVTAATANPDDPYGYTLQVAQELSLQGPRGTDLSVAPGTEPGVLDPLAAFLVAADLVLPSVRDAPPATLTADLRTASLAQVDPVVLTAADPCARFGQQLGTSWYVSRGWQQVPGLGGQNAAWSRALQQQLFGGTVQLTAGNHPAWHHAHDVNALQPLDYQIGIKVRVQIPRNIRCGPAIGSLGTVQGGAVNALVNWSCPGLDAHAVVDCSTATASSAATGVATLRVMPNIEKDPAGIGPEFSDTLTITGEVNLLDALGPELLNVLHQPANSRIFARKSMQTKVTWHRPYDVFVEIDSTLEVIEALQLKGHVATTRGSGKIKVTWANSGPFPQHSLGILDVSTTAATDGPKCKTPHVLASGGGKVDWQLLEVVIWPEGRLRVRMDSGPANETPDTITYVPCVGANITGTANMWEHNLFQGHLRKGLLYEGLAVGTGDGWSSMATDDTWKRGGVIAVYTGKETCGGKCKGGLTLAISVVPLDPTGP